MHLLLFQLYGDEALGLVLTTRDFQVTQLCSELSSTRGALRRQILITVNSLHVLDIWLVKFVNLKMYSNKN